VKSGVGQRGSVQRIRPSQIESADRYGQDWTQ
jgi:hypothetical protein